MKFSNTIVPYKGHIVFDQKELVKEYLKVSYVEIVIEKQRTLPATASSYNPLNFRSC